MTATTTGISTAAVYPHYLHCLAEADEQAAVEVAHDLLDAGVPADRVLLDLVAPAQAEVGERWARNEWSVAQEHAATHISERVVAAVAACTDVRATHGRIVVACMDGEWHALPARLVAEMLRLRGWQVTFLGASVPAAHLVSYLHRYDAHAVALACALPMRLPQAHRMIEACRRSDVPVVVGGRGFGLDGRWARRLGVPWAPNGPAAADLLADERALRAGAPTSLAHLADDEYAALVSRRGELIDSALADLVQRVPAAGDYSPAQLDSTVSDLGYILDFLAAALYVDDGTLFTEFVEWLVTILDSRGVPAAAVEATLGHYVRVLHDFPRATGYLQQGRAALPVSVRRISS
ncbi:Methanogenic corrinoid protein MtbC1 [Micromonospora phaseoli]|uniref:Methanogenic corrinoid protein MtbC1 n=1 Tax=Micromonospora phaseoli TaxID=1144548 RepID=A0A1H6YTT0_9ACTN|nr:cobalamin B12-binding domain-containing protein [Micromonospora phaseoli]PZW00320.1 methanogenic corrinoid protein MtbC1 [Micromonospora phaseoli]GIJ76797.1 cobalamin-binding protein [Micromonospora phaseoli]SEJ43234.1 Methanogenic corrinoid protein MtbC1 [Micromonospora phaseoli]